jgi:phosphoglycolate phosphatase-like HAD superfamily hydrolase
MLRIITDFDGPIMDVSERYYQAYRFCLDSVRRPAQEVTVLSKGEFWGLKRSQVPERKIGQLSGLDELQAQEFAQLRKRTVHTLPYLAYDTVKPTAVENLERITKGGIDLAVMTMRRVSELDHAFEKYDLGRFFPENRRFCLSNDYVKTSDVQDKPLLMERALSVLPKASDTWMVGDTEADIAAAKQHGIKSIAVLSGIRDRDQLVRYEPDYIVADLAAAVDLALKQSVETYAAS